MTNKPSEYTVFQMVRQKQLLMSVKSGSYEVSVLPLQRKNDSDQFLRDMRYCNPMRLSLGSLLCVVGCKGHIKTDKW